MEINVVLDGKEQRVLRDALLLYENACVYTSSCSGFGKEYN